MTVFFVFCAAIGGTVLICQLALMLLGIGGVDTDLDGDIGDLTDLGSVESPDGHDAGGQHGSTWLFGIVSFRTLIAAATFFGLGGLWAEALEANRVIQLVVGLGFGFAAMLGVHKIMGLFHRLSEDGTVRIQRAIGESGTVYVPIPPNRTGAGKVHVRLQNRIMEYPAVTANSEKLPTGSKIVVTDIIGSTTLEVAPAREPAETTVV